MLVRTLLPGEGCRFRASHTMRARKNAVLKCIEVYFENGDRGHYFVRGAVSWPVQTTPGYALIAGQHIVTGVIVIFKEFFFLEMGRRQVTDDTGIPRTDQGFAVLAELYMTQYGCIHYYYGGKETEELNIRYADQLTRAKYVKRKPYLVWTPTYKSDKETRHIDTLIFEQIQKNAIRIPDDSAVKWSIRYATDESREKVDPIDYFGKNAPNKVSASTIRAVRVLISAMNEEPYRKPSPKSKIKHATLTKDDFLNW